VVDEMGGLLHGGKVPAHVHASGQTPVLTVQCPIGPLPHCQTPFCYGSRPEGQTARLGSWKSRPNARSASRRGECFEDELFPS